MLIRTRLLALTLPLASCAPAAPPATPPARAAESAEALLDELNARAGAALIQAWNGDDPEAVAAFYEDDAVLVVNGATVYRGRAVILRSFLRPLVSTIDSLTPTIDQVTGGAGRLTLVGRYTARVSPSNGPAHSAEGAFSNSWRRQLDGTWRIVASLNTLPLPAGAAIAKRRAAPGEGVRVVRFNVKPDQRTEFERFFREDLMTAAARRQGIPLEQVDPGSFRVLVPTATNPQGYFTYYVVVDPVQGGLGSGDVMRDMVRSAFPGEEGERRVRRWMATMVLEPPLAPVGETFTEAELVASSRQR